MHHIRLGHGPDLLLLHGLGSSHRGWAPLLPLLEPHFRLTVPDLPGFGRTPLPPAPLSIPVLADAVEGFMDAQGLRGAAVAGFSMGGQLALELVRRGAAGPVVALAPGGFWMGWERAWIAGNISAGLAMVRAIKPMLPAVAALPATRALLFAQFCARPWAVAADVAHDEAKGEAEAPGTDPMLAQLVSAPMQPGLEAGEAPRAPVLIAWGREDRVLLPSQAPRAQAAFPGSRLEWVARAGHYIHWDQPGEVARMVRLHCGAQALLAAPG